MFPALRTRYPELEATLDHLESEHTKIATLLESLQTLLTSATPADLLPEIDTLITAVNTHLDHEEAQLIPLLDS
jgi:hypothetical protein